MRNVLALADKELRSYFASPIAYVIIGLRAAVRLVLLVYLTVFVRESERMMQMGRAPNVNLEMIRGCF